MNEINDLTDNRLCMIFYGHCLNNPNLNGNLYFDYKQAQYMDRNYYDNQPDLVYSSKFELYHWYDDITKYVRDIFRAFNCIYAYNNNNKYLTKYEVLLIVKDKDVWAMYYVPHSTEGWCIKKWEDISHENIGQDKAAKIKDALVAFYETNYLNVKRNIATIKPQGFEEIYLF